ncbi:hypothetical protein HS088_TW03G01229 [Tripterygium wilfordii]|uniref:Uncharacterized protein n=1 Tax=Tripterygium wilfordii TaxID=458696 RepID=A0A7J7DX86_TRIWF|nr:18.1 kDa class I heat shock protein-like [Tripterygium wilfordii]KAF5750889.1 hypothetical protein HS088_TW03G01229 [Tripterygium wilfordii]
MDPNSKNMSIMAHTMHDPFYLDVWEPFTIIPPRPAFSNETASLFNARIDWNETPEAHVLKADLPGLNKNEVKVEVEDNNVLRISGERHMEKEEKTDKWYRVERSSGKFIRQFRLPENAKPEKMKTSMENGVLTVTVPKEKMKDNRLAKSIQVY